MRRRLTKLAIFLLLGAMVNVAVAALVAQFSSSLPSLLRYAQAFAVDFVAENPGSADSGVVYGSFVDDGSSITFEGTVQDNGSTLITGIESIDLYLSVGWPLRSLQAHSHFRNGQWRTDTWLLPLVPRTDVFGFESQGELPLRPTWPGFAINTLFYAAILWPLICGPFVLRRLIRRKRGLCVVCGYDLRHADHEACPECGGTLGAVGARWRR